MTATNKLGLELLQNAAANQTLANTTFARLNQLVQAGVVDKDLAAPPSSPADESLYIVGPSATGAWAGRDGQLAYWLITAGAWQFINPKEGFFLHVNDEDVFYKFTGTAWEVFSGGGGGGMTNPMTSIRDLIVGGTGGAPTRLPGPTSEGLVLTRVGNALAWAIATGFSNPMTAGGDMIIGGTNGAAARLAGGSAGQVLTMVAGAPAWVTPSGSGGDFKSDGSVQMTGALNLAVRASHNTDSAGGVIPVAKVAASNTITVFGAAALTGMAGQPEGSERVILFAQALQITHNGSSFNLLGGANIQAVAGDWARFASSGTNSGWTMTTYSRYSGEALTSFVGGRLTKALDEADYNDGGVGVVDGELNLGSRSNTLVAPGNPTITRFTGGGGKGATRRIIFSDGGTLVNSSNYLDLPGAVDLALQSGDLIDILAVSATKWRVVGGMRKSGQALVAGAGFTEAQVRATPLTGLSTSTSGQIAAADTILAALGKLQAQLNGSVFRMETIATSTAGQTSYAVPNGYTAGQIQVWFNGVLLQPSEYTATDGTNVVLQTGAISTSDVMQVGVLGSLRTQDDALLQYTVANLPSASANAFKQRWCTNMAGGAGVVVSNGTNWVRVADNTTVTV